MRISNLKSVGKVLTNKEQKTVKGGRRGCGCNGDINGNAAGQGQIPCEPC